MRIPKSNLHTHTTFCDGKNSAEEMVLAAIDSGMETIGFSGHSTFFFKTDWCMTPENTVLYREEILRLRKLYGDRISILLGIEQDFYARPLDYPYDYVIGSVHYLPIENEGFWVDDVPEALIDAAKKHYGGDFYRLCRHYYQTVAEVVEKTRCDIVGHFDLITKFNEGGRFFDENDPRYLKAALDALDVLLEKDVVIEINTGAMSRGYRRAPYPSPMMLRRIAEKGGRVTITSDAHSDKMLLYGFSDALQLARASGLGSVLVMARDGWKQQPL